MSRESKIFTETKLGIGNRVKEYESFGWELLSINGTDVSMSRETQNKVYADLIKFEYKYEALREELAALVRPIKPTPINILGAFLGILCFIVPGVLYIIYKIKKSKQYQEELSEFELEYKKLLQEIKKVCEESRSTFFSRQ